MYTPFKMKGKSPMMKALIGGQKNLAKQGAPELQAAIEGAPVKKKTEAQKLNKLVDKRTKLRNKKTKRTELEKNTKRVDRKLEKNQTKINANSQAQKNFNDAKRVSKVKGGAKKALQSKESSVKMMKKSPTKLTGKERRAAIEKAKSGTYDNAKAKRKAVLEARKKANKEAVAQLMETIKDKGHVLRAIREERFQDPEAGRDLLQAFDEDVQGEMLKLIDAAEAGNVDPFEQWIMREIESTRPLVEFMKADGIHHSPYTIYNNYKRYG